MAVLRLLQFDHRIFQQAERTYYYNRRTAAQTNPETVVSAIVDGMQQSTCEIPKKFKYEYKGELLKQKLIGVLFHGNQE